MLVLHHLVAAAAPPNAEETRQQRGATRGRLRFGHDTFSLKGSTDAREISWRFIYRTRGINRKWSPSHTPVLGEMHRNVSYFSYNALIDQPSLSGLSVHGNLHGAGELRRAVKNKHVRHQPIGCLSTGRHLHRSNSQGREAGRPAGRVACHLRAGDQPQDSESARPRGTADRANDRRGSRITRLVAGRLRGLGRVKTKSDLVVMLRQAPNLILANPLSFL
jgi:hypothetical protein